ncbi:Centrosomal protein of 95 kDa [Rhizophlyctis rosea]|uniref:Centrosomal protein of 95 kDa n=1 Tax=Rhizophlyctis rosea TaxID=64517 RepID=A0AAD5S6M3_9FUNG|nr:Centrosomal protein of 95 kDa [Rhizophlyctis rosea]
MKVTAAIGTINRLLTQIHVPITLKSLTDCVPSLWVALFEGLFKTRIPGIIRSGDTSSKGTRIHNTQLVLNELGGTVLEMELVHISAEALVDGDVGQILDMVDIFGEIGVALSRGEGGGVSEEVRNDGHVEVNQGGPSNEQNRRRSPGPQHSEPFIDGSYSFQPTEALRQSSPQPGRPSSSYQYDNFDIDPFSWEAAAHLSSMEDVPPPPSSPTTTSSKRRRKAGSTTTATSEVKDDIGEFLANRARQRSKGKGGVEADSSSVVNDDNDSGTPIGTRKRLRFEMEDHKTPPVLRVLPTDTPHTKALKIKRARIIQEIDEIDRNRPNRRPTRSALSPHLSPRTRGSPYHLAYKAHLKARARSGGEWTVRSSLDGREISGRGAPSDGDADRETEFGSHADHYDDAAIGSRSSVHLGKRKKSIPEANLDELERITKEVLPGVDVPRTVKERTHNELVGSWRRALDDRVWRSTVEQQRRKVTAHDPKPLQQLQKEVNESMRLNRRKQESEARQAVKTDLAERQRRISRLENQRKLAEEEVQRVLTKRRLRDEQLVHQMYKGFVSEQRKAIIEERRLQKEDKKRKREAERVREEAEENFYRSQVGMLEERLEKVRRDERIARKARDEELRKIDAERKRDAKVQIRRFKDKLEVDAGDMVFRERDVERAREGLRFVAARRR